jgi:hypothetical protein
MRPTIACSVAWVLACCLTAGKAAEKVEITAEVVYRQTPWCGMTSFT